MASRNIRKNRSKVKIAPQSAVVVVNRSNKNIYAQLLEPVTRKVLGGVHTSKFKSGTKSEKSKLVGAEISKIAKASGFESVVFDRNGYVFHGRIQAVAEGIKENGIRV
jgi:large subunit ribosomal protein L18